MEQEENLKPIELEPIRPAVETPHLNEDRFKFLAQTYDSGRWDDIIDLCEKRIAKFVDSFPNPIFHAGDVTDLYFAKIAYRAKGEKDKYIACLKILFSLSPFGHAIGGKYRKALDESTEEYLNLAEKVGVDYLNELQVTGLFKKETGCFIATATYGSPLAEQVILLKEFRDSFLSRNIIGRTFVKWYYLFSPFFVKIIEKYSFAKSFAKFCLHPIIKMVKKYSR